MNKHFNITAPTCTRTCCCM